MKMDEKKIEYVTLFSLAVIVILLLYGVHEMDRQYYAEQPCRELCREYGYGGLTLSSGVYLTRGDMRCVCDRKMLNGTHDSWTSQEWIDVTK